MEYGKSLFVNNTMCFNEARQAGEFSVWNGQAGTWQTDRSLYVKILDMIIEITINSSIFFFRRVLCDPN